MIPGPLNNPGRCRLVSTVLYVVGGEELNGSRLKSVSCFDMIHIQIVLPKRGVMVLRFVELYYHHVDHSNEQIYSV